MEKTRNHQGVPTGPPAGGDGGGITRHKRPELELVNSTDDDPGESPEESQREFFPFWKIRVPGSDRYALCYATKEIRYDSDRGAHRATVIAWNCRGVRVGFTAEEWKTARQCGLAAKARPETRLQRAIVACAIQEEITQQSALAEYVKVRTNGYERPLKKAQFETRMAGEVMSR